MYYDYASTTCSTPSASRIRVGKKITNTNTRTDRNIHLHEDFDDDDNSDQYDFENSTVSNRYTQQIRECQPPIRISTQSSAPIRVLKDTSATNCSQKKRKIPCEEELPMVPDTNGMNEETNLRIESIEKTLNEIRSEQNSMMKLLEKIYQAQLTTLSHQKLNVTIRSGADIQPIIYNGINLVDKEPPIEPTALLCSSIRKLYNHDEIKDGIVFDERMQRIKELIKETYFKELPIEFDIFWERQAKKTIGGQKRAFCSRHKQKEYDFQVIAYLHSLGVAHRDLKPENLLIANNNALKICDFGLATLFRSQTTKEERKLTTYCGTAPYSSPEVWSKTPYRGEPVDVWSCGIILTAMLTGELPWDQPSYQNPEYKRWLDRDYYHNPWKKIDNMILNLLRRILVHDPAQRARVIDIQSHKWMSKIYSQDGTETDHQLLKRMAVKYDEPCWSLTQPNQSTTSTVISPSISDDSMVNCISQPIKLDDLILITEPRSLTEMGDQDPSEHLVHRMTRVVLAISFDETIYLLNRLFVHTGYTPKRTAGNQITVVTQDKRHTELIFKVNLFKIPDAKIMADFRLSKGDGIEFKRKFVEIRERLVQLATAWSNGGGGSAYFNHSDTSSTLTVGNNSVNQLQEAMDT
ncbi:unnamed protein product [Rotaria magnacalcarata]|uniref:non-specific serine/threonine protein kinase n=4 Tax=Rotaria magnacalcarata TaxID=392030 RepID=A0A816MTU6_9BILA|nr:unnamed protein product [Rotaria magnacalcarata]